MTCDVLAERIIPAEQAVPGQRILLTVLLAACLFLLHARPVCADDAPASEQLTALFRQLRSDQQPARVEAQRRLVELGLPAVPGIEREIDDAELDRLPYLISALEQMFVAGCLPVADAAERALDRLKDSQRPEVADRAEAVLIGNRQLRERRAVASLRELGADVLYEPISGEEAAALMMRPAPFGYLSEIVIPGHELMHIQVWLHDDWSGSEDDLWHISRLEYNWSVRTRGITVYNITGNGVSQEAVQGLAGRLTRASIQQRGGASLGILCNPNPDSGCTISEALPGGTAAAAGLRGGDQIQAMDGQPIRSFNELVSELLKRSPGETATLEVNNFGTGLREVEVTLGNWRPVVAARQQMIEERARATLPSVPDRFPFVPNLPGK